MKSHWGFDKLKSYVAQLLDDSKKGSKNALDSAFKPVFLAMGNRRTIDYNNTEELPP